MIDVTLDGRKFTGISQSLTAVQDNYIVGHLWAAGALQIMGDLDGKTRTNEKRAEKMVTQILLSGRKNYILAGCLTEEGKVWSCAEADANAVRFEGISDAEAKAAMQSSMVKFVIGFVSPKSVHLGGVNWSDDCFRIGKRIGRLMRNSSPQFLEVSGRQDPSWRIN